MIILLLRIRGRTFRLLGLLSVHHRDQRRQEATPKDMRREAMIKDAMKVT